MRGLIEAFTIFLKYGEVAYPTHCEHDIMYVYPAEPISAFTQTDLDRLEELGFTPDSEFSEEGAFSSYKYGSC